METYKEVYIAIDLHSKHSMIGYMNRNGEYMGQQQVETTGQNLVNQVVAIPAERKQLTIEQGNMAFWAAEQLASHVVPAGGVRSGPQHADLPQRQQKRPVGYPAAVQAIAAGRTQAGMAPEATGDSLAVLPASHRVSAAAEIPDHPQATAASGPAPLGHQRQTGARRLPGSRAGIGPDYLQAKFTIIGQLQAAKDQQLARVEQTGTRFWEIAEFQEMPGIGPVGAHTFSAYIQTPHRFRRKGQLIRFCQLGVRKTSSDGRELRGERLDKASHGCLKHLAHVGWKTALKTDNEVSFFYQASLARCGGIPCMPG